jgi:hypothetical protein
MWRLIVRQLPALLVCALLLTPAGCKRKKREPSKASEDEPAGLATMIHAADPRSNIQFVRGFYGVEGGSWRWTQKNFAITLKPPAGAANKGATLQLSFAIPDTVIQKMGPITLSASIGTVKLDPETYTKAGEYTYSRDVPASAMKGDAVRVDFALDKALPPTGQDSRELGIIVTLAGFEAKQ